MKKFIFVLACLTVIFSVKAEDSNLYFGASWVKSDLSDISGVEQDPGYEARLGYILNDFYSLELDYKDLGFLELPITADAGGSFDTTGYAVSLVASYPLWNIPNLNINVKTGYFWWESEGQLGTIAGSVEYLFEDNEFVYATGVSYDLSENFELKADYNNASSFSWIGVGVNYRF